MAQGEQEINRPCDVMRAEWVCVGMCLCVSKDRSLK